MTKSWPLLALAVLGAVAAIFCLEAFDWAAWACYLPAGEEGKVLTPKIGGCIEFWLNRYQTTIGAIAALIAAGLAWSAAQRQIAKADQQAEISRAQFSLAALEPLLQRSENLRAVLQELADARNLLNRAIEAMVNVNIALFRIIRDYENGVIGSYTHSVRVQTVDIDKIEQNFTAASKHAAEARAIAGRSLIEKIVQTEIMAEIEEIFSIDASFQQDVYLAKALRDKIADPDADEIRAAWLESVAPHVDERKRIRVRLQSKLLRSSIANTRSLIDEHLALIANQARPGT